MSLRTCKCLFRGATTEERGSRLGPIVRFLADPWCPFGPNHGVPGRARDVTAAGGVITGSKQSTT